MTTQPPTPKATLLGSHILNGINGPVLREQWEVTLTTGNVAIATDTITLSYGRMSDEWLQDWAARQTAEGYEANRQECMRLMELCDG